MFWGLIMEPQRRYSQTVKRGFHVSMAALDESTADDSPTQVICTFDDRNYLLCTLEKGRNTQTILDLNYEIGDKISFATNGKAHVHLTGYLLEDQFLEDEGEEEEEIEETDVVGKKRLKMASSNDSPPRKKSRTLELLNAINSNDEDDSDDSDVNMSDLMEEEDDTIDTTAFEEAEDEEDEDEEDDDEEDDVEEEEEGEEVEGEESDDSSSLSEDEVVSKKKKLMENGISGKKDKKQKEKPAEQTPDKKKQNEKQKKDKGKGEKLSPVKGEKTPAKSEKTPAKGDKTPAKGDKTTGKSPKQQGESPQKKTIEGGVIIEDVKLGNGQVAKPGKFVRVYYEGRFKNNNKMFDSTTKGAGFEFRLGRQEVIKGWDVGLAGMKVGGKRRIICPPNMAYGQKGSPPTIPPNSTLVFEVELKNVK